MSGKRMKRAGVLTLKVASTVNKTNTKTDCGRASQCHVCPICEDAILDHFNGQIGQDSIFCDGVCNTWLHIGVVPGYLRRLFMH